LGAIHAALAQDIGTTVDSINPTGVPHARTRPHFPNHDPAPAPAIPIVAAAMPFSITTFAADHVSGHARVLVLPFRSRKMSVLPRGITANAVHPRLDLDVGVQIGRGAQGKEDGEVCPINIASIPGKSEDMRVTVGKRAGMDMVGERRKLIGKWT